jgi:protocatechuate 4,5-dioxygenase alpha chain
MDGLYKVAEEKMITRSEDYSDIPGTYLFDKRACSAGYHLNMFCMSLMKEENRRQFLADEETYLDRYSLTGAQRNAILERNWLQMIQEGGNIYYVAKLGATCGFSFEELAAAMSGMTKESYRNMMLSGGRPPEGNRSKAAQAALMRNRN